MFSQITQWFHKDCFFKRHKPENTDIIANFKKLKNDDKTYIKEKIGIQPTEPTKTAEKKGTVEDDGNLFRILKSSYLKPLICATLCLYRRKWQNTG